MAAIDRIATARDQTFAARVAMLLMTEAINVANEDPGTTNHANRLHFAYLHMTGGVNTKVVAAAIIAFNATVQTTIDTSPALLGSNISDGDLTYVIGQLYDNLANAFA